MHRHQASINDGYIPSNMPSQGDFAKAKDKRGYMKLIYILYLLEPVEVEMGKEWKPFFQEEGKN